MCLLRVSFVARNGTAGLMNSSCVFVDADAVEVVGFGGAMVAVSDVDGCDKASLTGGRRRVNNVSFESIAGLQCRRLFKF